MKGWLFDENYNWLKLRPTKIKIDEIFTNKADVLSISEKSEVARFCEIYKKCEWTSSFVNEVATFPQYEVRQLKISSAPNAFSRHCD